MSNTLEPVQAVWDKGREIAEFDPAVWRHDDEGNVIKRDEYGNRDSDYGWEIDHIRPVSDGGSDDLVNLRPLQWAANASRR